MTGDDVAIAGAGCYSQLQIRIEYVELMRKAYGRAGHQ